MMKKLTLLLILLTPPIVAANDSCHPKTGTYQDCIAYLSQEIGVLKKQNHAQRANIKQQIGRLETENQAQLTKLERIQAQLAKLKQQTPPMAADDPCNPKDFGTFECILSITHRIAQLEKKNKAQQAEIQRLTADNQAQQAEIQRLTADNQAQQAEIQRLTKVDNKHVQTADKLSKRLNKQAETVGELSKRITAVDNKHVQTADKLSKRLTALDNKQAEKAGGLSKRLNKHIQTAGELFEQNAALNNKQAQTAVGLSKRLNKQAETVGELSKRVTALDNKQAEMAAKLCMPFAKQNDNIDWTPGKVFHDCLKDGTKGPKMVAIPPGTFRMGDIQGGGYSDEQPVHEVSIKRVAMGRYVVTVGEFRQFVNATGYQTDAEKQGSCYVYTNNSWNYVSGTNWRNPGHSKSETHPVTCISWDDATAYAKWLTKQTGHHYRLPTEAEWEYTARAGTETKYWWGNDIGKNRANCYGNYCGDSFEYTAPVGSFAANPFGLFDTTGNLWEWTCSEYQDKYSGKEQRCANSGSLWAQRGGAWNNLPGDVRVANRYSYSRDSRFEIVGFRLARQF